MGTAAVLVSRAEFDARAEAGERIEYDQGLIVEMPYNDSEHEILKGVLNRELVTQIPRSAILLPETTFELAADRVRQPDLAVLLHPPRGVSGERLQGAPDLAIEIVSPSDRAGDLETKISLYLSFGAAAVWVVYPAQRAVRIHRRDGSIRNLVPGDVLTGEPPIPMFQLNLAELFA